MMEMGWENGLALPFAVKSHRRPRNKIATTVPYSECGRHSRELAYESQIIRAMKNTTVARKMWREACRKAKHKSFPPEPTHDKIYFLELFRRLVGGRGKDSHHGFWYELTFRALSGKEYLRQNELKRNNKKKIKISKRESKWNEENILMSNRASPFFNFETIQQYYKSSEGALRWSRNNLELQQFVVQSIIFSAE